MPKSLKVTTIAVAILNVIIYVAFAILALVMSGCSTKPETYVCPPTTVTIQQPPDAIYQAQLAMCIQYAKEKTRELDILKGHCNEQ